MLLDGQYEFDPTGFIALGGSPQAADDRTVVFMYDYPCPACAGMHQYLKQARARYDDQLCMVLICVPMEARCNPHVQVKLEFSNDSCALAKLALATWQRDAAAFEQVHDSFLDPDGPPDLADAREMVAGLIGADAVDTAEDDPAVQSLLDRNLAFYETTQRGRVPKLFFADIHIWGQPDNAGQVFDMLEQKLGAKPSS